MPAFVRSWLSGRGFPDRVFAPTFLTVLGAAGTIIGAVLSLTGRNGTASTVLVLTGAGQIARMAGWALPSALRHPPLAMLLAGWVWLGAGLVLTGLALGFPDRLAIGDALHGLTMGRYGNDDTCDCRPRGHASPPRRRTRAAAADARRVRMRLAVGSCTGLRTVGRALARPVTLAAGLWMVGWGLFPRGAFPGTPGARPTLLLEYAERAGAWWAQLIDAVGLAPRQGGRKRIGWPTRSPVLPQAGGAFPATPRKPAIRSLAIA